MTPGAMDGLRAVGVKKHYGGVLALNGVDLFVPPRQVVGLIGPNGAGKTTLLDVLTGTTTSTHGRVTVDGRDVGNLGVHQRARLGLGRSFQGVRLFNHLSVRENVELGVLQTTRSRAVTRSRCDRLLDRLGLGRWAEKSAGDLPYGIARRVGLARCLAASPRYLLLDEPAAGLDEEESLDLASFVGQLPQTHECAVLVIEHHMPFVAACCERVQVLDEGTTLANGPVKQVFQNQKVIDAYLGEEAPC